MITGIKIWLIRRKVVPIRIIILRRRLIVIIFRWKRRRRMMGRRRRRRWGRRVSRGLLSCQHPPGPGSSINTFQVVLRVTRIRGMLEVGQLILKLGNLRVRRTVLTRGCVLRSTVTGVILIIIR
jgi:hypothetical protein